MYFLMPDTIWTRYEELLKENDITPYNIDRAFLPSRNREYVRPEFGNISNELGDKLYALYIVAAIEVGEPIKRAKYNERIYKIADKMMEERDYEV